MDSQSYGIVTQHNATLFYIRHEPVRCQNFKHAKKKDRASFSHFFCECAEFYVFNSGLILIDYEFSLNNAPDVPAQPVSGFCAIFTHCIQEPTSNAVKYLAKYSWVFVITTGTTEQDKHTNTVTPVQYNNAIRRLALHK